MGQLSNNSTEILARKIEQKRQEMMDTAAIQGMKSKETLTISQELDRLILAYQTEKAD